MQFCINVLKILKLFYLFRINITFIYYNILKSIKLILKTIIIIALRVNIILHYFYDGDKKLR